MKNDATQDKINKALDEMSQLAQENGEYDPPFDNPLVKNDAIDQAIKTLEGVSEMLTEVGGFNETLIYCQCSIRDLRQYKEEQGWLPIETAPRNGRRILAIKHNGICYDEPLSVFWSKDKSNTNYPWRITGHEDDNSYSEGYFDYFQPLPEPPQTTEDGE